MASSPFARREATTHDPLSPWLLLVLSVAACGGREAPSVAPPIDAQTVAGASGVEKPETNAAGVVKVSWPPKDVDVAVDGWKMPPFMGLTSWAAFAPGRLGVADATVMGDLVLFEDEVNPVISVLVAQGLQVRHLPHPESSHCQLVEGRRVGVGFHRPGQGFSGTMSCRKHGSSATRIWTRRCWGLRARPRSGDDQGPGRVGRSSVRCVDRGNAEWRGRLPRQAVFRPGAHLARVSAAGIRARPNRVSPSATSGVG